MLPVRNRPLIPIALLLPALLAGCPGADYPTCSSTPVTHPDGSCSAYYYQTDYGSGGATTQAMTECVVGAQRGGGNIVAFHTLQHGIGLRWLDPNTLEVSVPDGIKLEDQQTRAIYSGYPLRYIYRRLQPGSQAIAGCTPMRREGGA